MSKKSEPKEDENEQEKNMNNEEQYAFKEWAESYNAVSKMWEDSYSKLYRPWIESSEEAIEKAIEISKDATPKMYQEFYDEWFKTYNTSFGQLYQVPTRESSKETLKTVLDSAEKTIEVYKSWIAELEENSDRTRKLLLLSRPDPVKYQNVYEAWIKSYNNMFDDMLTLPYTMTMKEIFEQYTGIPDIYVSTFVQIADLWRKSYAKMYGPWVESMHKLSEKTAEISRGKAGPEAYREFYTLWMNTYMETYDQYLQSMQPSKEAIDDFLQTTNIYLQKYKSWAEALKKMSDKTDELSKNSTDPETYKQFYDLWINMYNKGIGTFFEDMPTVGPMKEMMEPVRIMARMYMDNLSEMSKMWVRWDYGDNRF